MSKDQDNLPVQTEKPSLAEYLDSLLPFRIPRIPFVRTAANLDKAAARLILAKAEQRAARMDAFAAKIKHQSNVEGRFLEASERIAEQAIKRNQISSDAAFAYLEAETSINFSNRTRILEEAVAELNYDPPKEEAIAEIDNDWLNTFARMAEEKSSAELQNLFGKILAGEIRRPGAFSLRTLFLVSTLSRTDATQIVSAFRFVLDHTFIADLDDFEDLSYSQITALSDIGIITGLRGHLEYKIQPKDTISISAKNCRLEINSDVETTLTLNAHFLTEPGQQLFKIAEVSVPPIDYLRIVATEIALENAEQLNDIEISLITWKLDSETTSEIKEKLFSKTEKTL